ncbi:hypothetical protein DL95DRAFT_387145, partial [Leptodontidium sp. 2 PMI_412]
MRCVLLSSQIALSTTLLHQRQRNLIIQPNLTHWIMWPILPITLQETFQILLILEHDPHFPSSIASLIICLASRDV